ncbi:MAG: regulatory iron-sulfur-containing complex subunit RicT [Melioribacteraceae bacterium]|nr:MAG: regulatory iron-sulfur-containing complex subunit RicT [Melioribacteraceae bacterium]
MYKIDFSFIHNKLISPEELKELEVNANQQYQVLVKEKINHPNHQQISGCLVCGADCMMEIPIDNRRIVEVECKGMLGCHFAELTDDLNIIPQVNEKIILEGEDYHEIGIVKENSELLKIKRAELGLFGEKLPKIIRVANEEDLQKYNLNLLDEHKAKPIFLKLVEKHSLNMKLVHIHYQFDRKRLFFFYTSDGRVDFRELAKELAGEFKTRIELRQIGVRDEAKSIGGLGTCGREFCCASFLNNFKRISTQLASDQNLNSNLSKLSGPCGKLKCCISFEIDEN